MSDPRTQAEELLALAERATPGPWTFQTREVFGFGKKKWVAPMQQEPGFTATGFQGDEDSAHIAACDPTTIATLMRRLLALEDVAEAAQVYVESGCGDDAPCGYDKLDRLETTLARLEGSPE